MPEIKLSQGKVAIVDEVDHERVSQFKWSATNCPNSRYPEREKWYAIRREKMPNGRWVGVYLHRFLLPPPAGMVVDHRDGDGLNCRRDNLRITTKHFNAQPHNRTYAEPCL